jgi:hypothetical protein
MRHVIATVNYPALTFSLRHPFSVAAVAGTSTPRSTPVTQITYSAEISVMIVTLSFYQPLTVTDMITWYGASAGTSTPRSTPVMQRAAVEYFDFD